MNVRLVDEDAEDSPFPRKVHCAADLVDAHLSYSTGVCQHYYF